MRCLLALLFCCSGVGATERICLQPSDRIVFQSPCDVVIQPIAETNPARSALLQSLNGPNVMLWIGGKTQAVVDRFPRLISEARQYPNIKSVYLYDELFWSNDRLSVQIGLHESEVLAGAQIAHAAGLQTAISIPPQVILHPDFRLRDSNAFDTVGIDVYPVNGITPTPGCSFDANPYSTALYCSYIKLRQQGYRGRIGYIAQGFGVWGMSYAETLRQLTLQRATIDKALSMNVDALMVWGVSLGAPELAAEPWLIPLAGTAFEVLIKP